MDASDSTTQFRFDKEIYPKTALLKTAFRYTDAFYVHLSADADQYTVTLEPKPDAPVLTLADFRNALLEQTVREEVAAQTKDLRFLLMARALSSSMIDTAEPEETAGFEGIQDEALLKDWFTQNE